MGTNDKTTLKRKLVSNSKPRSDGNTYINKTHLRKGNTADTLTLKGFSSFEKRKSLDDYIIIYPDDDDGCNESKMMMAGGGWWWLLYPAGPLYCYWPTLITLRPTLNDTGDNHGGGKP